MTRQAELRLTPLVCPSCAANLPALEDDVAFACAACAGGYELDGTVLLSRSLHVVRHPAARTGFHLPFWAWAGGTRVPAFNTREVVDLARRLSGRDLTLGAPPPRLLGGSLGSREAREIASFAGLGDATGPPALLAIPFLDEGSRLLEAVTGFVLYKETIDRARALLAALARTS